jgi:hypothetical protein
MAHYGQLLDIFEPDKEKMYKAFSDYFNNPIMYKIKDVNNHSMYMSKTSCLLTNECRYIICFLPKDNMNIGTKDSLSTLRWISLQTRAIADNHDLPAHGYHPKREGCLNIPIFRTNVTSEASTYKCDTFPLIITLLHKKSEQDYQSRGNIIAALETYSTIITLQ